ncbi:PucR family transcriptional regulator [Burkholderia alba]|uniref:PucR family transcriptional regulator n=1 Tax=Burkholderia alba TaxID=2683677 RepID=UPI002B05C251|nr:PucR family transcriptional regulator ligand-binding domain-containing protein [Burkholderia alba]
MSLTVGEILQLPGLEELALRAGERGIPRSVRWYYVAENEGIADWVMGGELVFVTGINHPRDEQNLLQLIREGAKSRIAGMVILTGEAFIRRIPDSVIALAQELDIPLIEQPYLLKMVIVTQLIGTALVRHENTLRSQRDILNQLLTGDYPSIDIANHRAHNLQLRLDRPRRVVALRLAGVSALFDGHDPDAAEALLQDARLTVQRHLEEWGSEQEDALPLVIQGELFVMLMPCDDAQFRKGKQMLAALHLLLGRQIGALTLYIGISATVGAARHYCRALIEARQALGVAESMRPGKGLCDYSDLGVLKLLAAIPDPVLIDSFVKETLGSLIDSNRKHPTMLIETLEALLQENGNTIKAAEHLAIHRNTLNHRLRRIEQQSGQSLADPQFRLNASVALLAWRMSDTQRQELS